MLCIQAEISKVLYIKTIEEFLNGVIKGEIKGKYTGGVIKGKCMCS